MANYTMKHPDIDPDIVGSAPLVVNKIFPDCKGARPLRTLPNIEALLKLVGLVHGFTPHQWEPGRRDWWFEIRGIRHCDDSPAAKAEIKSLMRQFDFIGAGITRDEIIALRFRSANEQGVQA